MMKTSLSKQEVLAHINGLCEDTLMETLQIKYVDVDVAKGKLVATMPVDSRVY
jgi:hypothetical protein